MQPKSLLGGSARVAAAPPPATADTATMQLLPPPGVAAGDKGMAIAGAATQDMAQYTLTRVQAKGLAKATESVAADVALADAALEKGKDYTHELWDKWGGAAIDALLEHTSLVNAQFLVALHVAGGVVPRGQDVPEAALISAHNAWRLRWEGPNHSVLVLSYPWLDDEHPDREGEQLAMIAPILEVMLANAKGKGAHNTVGVLWDYMCLPQQPRTPAEDAAFNIQLAGISEWYAHPATTVLLVTTPVPTGADYGRKGRPYHSRGWCFVEMRLGALIKGSLCLWDLSSYKGGAKDIWALQEQMKAGRPPPMSPEWLAPELCERVSLGSITFASEADAESVIALYARGFVRAFEIFRTIDDEGTIWYRKLGWDKAAVPTLVAAIKYAEEQCVVVSYPGAVTEDQCDVANVGMRMKLLFEGNDFPVAEQWTQSRSPSRLQTPSSRRSARAKGRGDLAEESSQRRPSYIPREARNKLEAQDRACLVYCLIFVNESFCKSHH